jgi:hypothetical protein
MACKSCVLGEKKFCEEYGLPSVGMTVCWITGKQIAEEDRR